MTQHIFWYPTKLGSGITDNNAGSPTKSVIDGKNNVFKEASTNPVLSPGIICTYYITLLKREIIFCYN